MIPFFKKHPRFGSLLLCLLSSVLLILSFPKFDYSPLVWFALVPWFFAIDGKTRRGAFGLSFFTGFIFYAGTLYWFKYVTWAGAFLLTSYLSLFFGFFALGYLLFNRQSLGKRILFYACLWVSLEYFRSNFLSGFGWVTLSHTQYQNTALIQIADITGTYGITFLVVAVNVLIKENLAYVFGMTDLKHPSLIKMNAGLLCILLMVYGYGLFRLSHPVPMPYVKVGVIQGNIPQEEKWMQENRTFTIQKYLTLSKAALNEHPDFLIWPETAFPGLIEEMPQLMEDIREFSRAENIPLLIGVVAQESSKYYNSALLITPDGKMNQRYDKFHLVPFGEFLPFRKQLPFLAHLIPIEDFSPGTKARVFTWPIRQKDIRFSTAVCFEDTLAYITRRFVLNGAHLLINITNDAWFGDTKEPFLHLQAAIFRTIETRRALVRAANTGISCFIDPYGRFMKFVQNAGGKKTYIDGTAVFWAPLNSSTTFYTKAGDIFTYLCFVCILCQGYAKRANNRTNRKKYAS